MIEAAYVLASLGFGAAWFAGMAGQAASTDRKAVTFWSMTIAIGILLMIFWPYVVAQDYVKGKLG